MNIKCENVVRCGNYNCCHNQDGYYCKNTVIALDTSGKCAFVKSKLKPEPTQDFETELKKVTTHGALDY